MRPRNDAQPVIACRGAPLRAPEKASEHVEQGFSLVLGNPKGLPYKRFSTPAQVLTQPQREEVQERCSVLHQKFDTFDGAKPRFSNRGKKRRSVSTLSIPRALARGVEWVDFDRLRSGPEAVLVKEAEKIGGS